MKKVVMSTCLLAVTILGVSCGGNSDTVANNDTTTNMTDASAMATTSSDTSMKDDRDFVMEAANGGMMEVELGKYAAAHATSAKVKEFGNMMVTDHTKANDELKSIAASKNITIPATMDEDTQKKVTDLESKKGADFDKAYVDMMVDDHQEDIDKFKKEATDGNDADVKAFAAKTLPVLQKHLDSIKSIKDGMK